MRRQKGICMYRRVNVLNCNVNFNSLGCLDYDEIEVDAHIVFAVCVVEGSISVECFAEVGEIFFCHAAPPII